MSVFGGVQVVSIFCSVVRAKMVSVWVGAVGVGLIGIYNSAIDLIINIVLLGIGSSSVRDVSASTDDEMHCRRTITVVHRWSRVLGIAGTLLILGVAPLLSLWSFGDYDHAWAFRALAACVFFSAMMQGELGILQGLRRFKQVANSTLLGAVVGLSLSAPLFYYLKVDSVVPVILLSAVVAWAMTWLNRERKLKGVKNLTTRETIEGGKSLIALGFYITLSTVMSLAASYILMSYLNTRFNTSVAGYFQAGFTLINRYVGLVFAGIAVEYYPRLSSVARRCRVSEVYVSHEMKLALCVLVPLVSLFIVCAPWIVHLLYSSDFMEVVPFVEIGMVGTVFRAVSWCMSFVILVKGDGRIFVLTEGLSAVLYMVLNVFAINHFGIHGMGWAYLGWYVGYCLIVGVVYYRRYRMRLRAGIKRLVVWAVGMVGAVCAVSMSLGRWQGALLTMLALATSIMIMRKKKAA